MAIKVRLRKIDHEQADGRHRITNTLQPYWKVLKIIPTLGLVSMQYLCKFYKNMNFFFFNWKL